MKLRGAEKRIQTAEQKAHRKARRIGLSKQKIEWDRLYSKLAPTDYEDPNDAFTMGDLIAYCAGWRAGARIKLWSLLGVLWPQQEIYETLYAESPFVALVKKDA